MSDLFPQYLKRVDATDGIREEEISQLNGSIVAEETERAMGSEWV